jgi:hypothetical protein
MKQNKKDEFFQPAYYPSVVDFARQIIIMQETLDQQKEELKELRDYRKKYMDLLDQSISHGREMMGGILQLAMTEGVMEAIGKANQEEEV